MKIMYLLVFLSVILIFIGWNNEALYTPVLYWLYGIFVVALINHLYRVKKICAARKDKDYQ